MTTARVPQPSFLLCIKNDGYPASLEVRKVYQAIADVSAARRGYVSVVDESGEDYLYPETYFVPIDLPQAAARAFAQAS
jgi:hypothetical protein